MLRREYPQLLAPDDRDAARGVAAATMLGAEGELACARPRTRLSPEQRAALAEDLAG